MEAEEEVFLLPGARIKTPPFFTRRRVDGDDDIQRGAEVDRAVHEGGRRTTALFVAKNVTGDSNIRRLPASDDAQIIKVFGRDFSQGRVLRANRVVAVILLIVGCALGVEDTAEEPKRRQGVVEMCHTPRLHRSRIGRATADKARGCHMVNESDVPTGDERREAIL